MKSSKLFYGLLFIAVVIFSCTKDRLFDASSIKPTPPSQTDTLLIAVGNGDSIHLYPGDLTINEFVATGSTYPNQLTTPSDWVELYNNRSDTMTLLQDHWFATDSLGEPGKFKFPETFKIPPHGFFVFMCDDSSQVSSQGGIEQLHTSFGLSKSGEQIGLYYATDTTSYRVVDTLSFSAQTAGPSSGRFPDGSTHWYNLGLVATPGLSNHQ